MSQSISLVEVDVDHGAALLVRDVDGQYRPASHDEVLSQVRRVLSRRMRRGAMMSSPQVVKDYLRLHIGVLEHEVFCVLFLDAQHRIIELKQMFRGSVTQTAVYPREVVKQALGGGEAGLGLQRGGDHPGAQPSIGIGRAEPGGRVHQAGAKGGVDAGRCPADRPLRRDGGRDLLVCRAGIAVAATGDGAPWGRLRLLSSVRSQWPWYTYPQQSPRSRPSLQRPAPPRAAAMRPKSAVRTNAGETSRVPCTRS